MFLAMASNVLSARTFAFPLLKYLRNCISCFKSPKEPSACMLRFVLKRIPSSESIRSKSSFLCFRNVFAPEVSLSVLPRVFCSYSLWCIRFCKGIHYSPHIYKSFFRLHILFCFLSGGYDLHLIFYHFCRYRYLFYIILHIFYLTDIIFIFTGLGNLIVRRL